MPWLSQSPWLSRVHKSVAVKDRRPGGARGPWGPWGARRTLHPEAHAGGSRLPLLSFQSIDPGAPRPSGEADLPLVSWATIGARGSSEAGLPLGSFLGCSQCSAIRTKDLTRLTLLTLGSRGALLALRA